MDRRGSGSSGGGGGSEPNSPGERLMRFKGGRHSFHFEKQRGADVFTSTSSHPETNPTPKKRRDDAPVQSWVKKQEDTFTKWVNNRLEGSGIVVSDLTEDLKDGLALIALLEGLTEITLDVGFHVHKKPKIRVQKLENVTFAFDFMEKDEGIELVSISPSDIVDGKLKLILGLIWRLILKYQIAVIHPNIQTSPRKVTPRNILLAWFQAVLPHRKITNFTSNWSDGINLSALVNYCKPSLIPDHASLDPSNALECITNAMHLAKENFGIPQVITPQDLAVDPDEPSVMTYLSYFCCPNSIGQDYLLEWITSVIPEENITNFTSDWKDGEALCALVEAFLPHSLPTADTLEDPLEKTQLAMEVAEKELQVKHQLSPEEFIHSDIDQISIMSYLTRFRFVEKQQSWSPQMVAVGPGITGGHTGKDASFFIRGNVPSDDDLTVTVTSPEGSILDFEEIFSPSGNPSFQYTPDLPGTYVIDVTYSGVHISGSPYVVTHTTSCRPDTCTVSGRGISRACIGIPAEFLVDCSSAGSGNLNIEIEDPSGDGVETSIEPKGDGVFQVRFVPDVSLAHSVKVTWSDIPIPGSPFTCQVSDPSMCVARGDGLSGGNLGQPSTFQVATEGAGTGNLSATVYGPSEPVELTLLSRDETTFVYQYTPQQTGQYIIEIKWDGFSIPGSPFAVHPAEIIDTSKCFITEMPIDKVRVGTPVTVIVDTTKAGPASLRATVSGPSTEEPCDVTKVEEGVYRATFIPHEVGQYTVDILCGDSSIPDSPLDFTVNDPSKCQINESDVYFGSYLVHKPVSFKVSTHAAGEGNLEATGQGPRGDFTCDITEEEEGSYLVSFTPEDPGKHFVDLFFDGEPFLVSPVEVQVDKEGLETVELATMEMTEPLEQIVDWFFNKDDTDGTEEDLKSIVLTKPISRTGYHLVDTVLEFRMYAPKHEAAGFSVNAFGTKTGATPFTAIVPTGDHTYNINFKATSPDDYTLELTYKEQHLPGSPFTLVIHSPSAPEKVVSFDPVIPLRAGNPIELIFDASQAGIGTLTTNIALSSGDCLRASVEEASSDLYRVSFTPQKEDTFTASILWSGQAITGSPFIIEFKEQTIDPPVSIQFEPEMQLRGLLSTKCAGQNMGAVNVDVRQFERGKYQLSFNPSRKDIYTLHVFWFEKEVKGSPFTIDLISAPAKPQQQEVSLESIQLDLLKRGILSACVIGKNSGAVPIQMQLSQNKELVHILFEERVRDIYDLFVYWNRRPLKGAPFRLDYESSI